MRNVDISNLYVWYRRSCVKMITVYIALVLFCIQ